MAEGGEKEDTGQFSEEYFTHVLSEGEEDYDDYTEQDLLKHPELAYTDEQVQREEQKLSAQEKQVFQELQAHHLLQYRTQGYMTPMMDVVKQAVHERYPGLPGSTFATILAGQEQLYSEFQEQKKKGKTSDTGIDLSIVKQEIKQELDISELSLYPGKMIKDVIDLTTDEDKNIYIKVQTNQMLHDVLTYGGEEEDDIFCAEEKVEEISIGSSDEDDPFVSRKAAEVLRKMARNKRDLAKLMEEAGDLLEEDLLPLEEAKEVFKSGIDSNTKSTPGSEKLFEECKSVDEFHLILALGYRMKEEAKAMRAIKKDRAYKVQTFDRLAEFFEVKKNTIINNLNQAVEFHGQRKERCDLLKQREMEEDSPTKVAKVSKSSFDASEYFERPAESSQ